MKITIVQGAFLPVPPLRGGAVEKVWFALGQEFARTGHEVLHVSRTFPGLPNVERIAGVEHRRVGGFDAPQSLLLLKLRDLAFSLRVAAMLPRADILVTNTFWLPILRRSASRGHIYVHVARYPRGQMRFYRHVARLQTVSQPIADAITGGFGIPKEKVRVIPYPVLDASSRAPFASRAREILFVGRLHPEKGVHLLISAFQKLAPTLSADWKLVIVGPSAANAGGGGAAYEAELRALAAGMEERIVFTGPVFSGPELDAYYRQATLFVYPSLAELGETFGLAPLEAMARGCPTLVSGLACFRQFVRNGENAFVFDHTPADATGNLAGKLRELLTHPELLERSAARAVQTLEDFSLERVSSAFLEDFGQLLAPAQ